VNDEIKILMVCLGNICRSPMAEGIMRNKLNQRNISAFVDSAGTGGWHAGENPDRRAIKNMLQHGIDISTLVARQFTVADFNRFDLILAMDETNYADILRLALDQREKEKVQLILKYIDYPSGFSVPDPWYGNQDGFETVYRMLDEACEAVIKKHCI
jgi:protein-tyrosine phosphatase